MKPEFYWHIYNDKLVNPVIDTIDDMLEYIKTHDKPDELSAHLKLLKPVKGRLPQEVIKAGEKYIKVVKRERDKAWKDYKSGKEFRLVYNRLLERNFNAYKAYLKTTFKYKDEIEALHKIECPNCPCNEYSIFKEEI